jgi:hypothetical protein
MHHDPRALAKALFDRAGKLWGWSLGCQLVVFGCGILLLVFPWGYVEGLATVGALLLSGGSAVLLWRRDVTRDNAEALLRKLDLKDLFGWELSRAEISDLLADAPQKLIERLPVEGLGEEYFSSRQPAGPRRSMENLEESAWLSKHLSKLTSRYCVVVATVLLCVPVCVLLISAQAMQDVGTSSLLARLVIVVLTLIFSLDLLRLVTSYQGFRRNAGRAEHQARNLLANRPIDVVPAVKVMQEYHTARAMAPLLPTWVWRLHESRLNQLWKQYRAKK